MRVLEVRCCSDPGKLLGWMIVPEDLARPGTVLRFRLEPDVRYYMPRAWVALPDGTFESWAYEAHEQVELTVGEWIPTGAPPQSAELAVKSNGTPIEKLRRLPAFLEVPDLVEGRQILPRVPPPAMTSAEIVAHMDRLLFEENVSTVQRAALEEIRRQRSASCPHEWVRQRNGRRCALCGLLELWA